MTDNLIDFHSFLASKALKETKKTAGEEREFFEHLGNQGVRVKEVLETHDFMQNEGFPQWIDLLLWNISHDVDTRTTQVTLAHNNHVLQTMELDEGISTEVPFPTTEKTTPLVEVTFTDVGDVSVLPSQDERSLVLTNLFQLLVPEDVPFISPSGYIPLYFIKEVMSNIVQYSQHTEEDNYRWTLNGMTDDHHTVNLVFYVKECQDWMEWHRRLYHQVHVL